MSQILVTGASGYVGTQLLAALLRGGAGDPGWGDPGWVD